MSTLARGIFRDLKVEELQLALSIDLVEVAFETGQPALGKELLSDATDLASTLRSSRGTAATYVVDLAERLIRLEEGELARGSQRTRGRAEPERPALGR